MDRSLCPLISLHTHTLPDGQRFSDKKLRPPAWPGKSAKHVTQCTLGAVVFLCEQFQAGNVQAGEVAEVMRSVGDRGRCLRKGGNRGWKTCNRVVRGRRM